MLPTPACSPTRSPPGRALAAAPTALPVQATAKNDALFADVWSIVHYSGFVDSASLHHTSIALAVMPLFSTLHCANPVAPYNDVQRRRRRNFGRRTLTRRTTHDNISPFLTMHLCWKYLDRASRLTVCATHPIMRDYASLRRDAFVHRPLIREALQAPRPPPEEVPPLCPFRARFMGAALLSFDFDYGDLVRWLEGEYTNQTRDWDALREHMAAATAQQQKPGYPDLEPDIAMESFEQGVPLAGIYHSKRTDALRHIEYDNHPPLRANLEATREKFGKEEAKSFHIAFPRFIAYFLFGLMIAPISWVVRKGKGRLVIDSSAKLDPDDSGAVNEKIPKPGTEHRERENPKVYFGSALMHHLQHVYNLRINFPLEDILQHTDDIDSAFRRMLYHPDLATAFAYVFMEYVIIPVGQIFGSRNSPAFWCAPAEIRAHMGATLDYSASDLDLSLAESVTLPPEPTTDEIANFVPAVPDALNQGVAPEFTDRPSLIMYVDDDICCAIRPQMRDALRSAVGSAYQMFGAPGSDRRGSCLVSDKFPPNASSSVEYIGYVIDTRLLQVEWPGDKVDTLRGLLHDWSHHTTARSPKEIAQLLGYIRNGAFLCPMGNFLSIRLQWTLNGAIQKHGFKAVQRKQWWRSTKVHIPPEVTADLRLMLQSLFPQNASAHSWIRPIAMLIPREPTGTVLSDAAHSGLGGWSPTFHFLWRLTHDDMKLAGFNMQELDSDQQERYRYCKKENLPAGHEEWLHINPLEFIAIIINVWFVILFIRKDPDRPGGHHILVRADNTSALSWLRYAARSQRRMIRNLAYFLHGLILFSQTAQYANFNGKHIAGQDNSEADGVSRPELYPSLASAIAAFSPLRTCQPFRIPFGLASTLARWITYEKIEAQHVAEMTNLLKLEPTPFEPGAIDKALASGLYRRSRRKQSLQS